MKSNFNFAGAEVSLADLEPGDAAVVVEVDDSGPLGRRLLDLGFIPETPVEMVRRAPLGDPFEFALRGCHLCLRRADAERVRVRRLDAERVRVERLDAERVRVRKEGAET